MSERTAFSLEDRLDRTTAAALLRGIAADLAAGDRLRLGDGDDAASVALADSLAVEVELEVDDEDDETELEVEFEWAGSDVRTGEAASADVAVEAVAPATAGTVGDDERDPGVEDAKSGSGDGNEDAESAGAEDAAVVDEEELPSEAIPAPDAAPPASLGRFELYRDRADEWRWRLVHRNGNIVATSGEGYTTANNARKGIRSVMRNAPGAELVRKE